MKKTLLLMLFILFQQLAMAQGGPGMGRQFDPSRMVAAEKQLLLDSVNGLNDDQKIIIEAIYEDYLAAITKSRESMDDMDRDTMRENMVKIRNEKDKALKEILTEAQNQRFVDILERRREQMRRRRGTRNE